MNIKDFIEQATIIEEHGWGASYEYFDKEKFAELVAAHEREQCLNCYSPDDTAIDWANKIKARSKHERC